MATTYPDISLSLNMARFTVPKAEDSNLASVDENGLHLYTGGDANYALGSTPVAKATLAAAVNGIQHLTPQTVTLAYQTMHLVTGMTVDLNYNFSSIDPNFNDFAFSVLSSSTGSTQSALLYDEKYFDQQYASIQGTYNQVYTILQGYHKGSHFDVTQTGDYTLVVGIADVGDKTGTSGLALTDVSIGLRGSSYTVLPALGLSLQDGTILALNGLEVPATGNAYTASDYKAVLLAASGQAVVTAFAVNALNQGITQTVLTQAAGAGGLLATNAGGDIALAAGGLASLTTLTSVPGAGLVATNGSGLISQDGGGVISNDGGSIVSHDAGGLISQDGGGLISQDGGGVISNDGGSIVSHDAGGLISQDGGGLISQDGGGVISNDGGSLAASGGTANFFPNGIGASGDLASSGDAGSAIAYATAAPPRSYTLTGDPGVTPAAPPVAGREVVASDAAAGATQRNAPAVAGLSDGRYVTVWADNLFTSQGGIIFNNGNYEIRGQIFNADGTKSGGILTISPFLGRDQVQPSVTGLAGGRFVVTWTGYDLSAGLQTQVEAQFYNADGSRNGTNVYVAPSTRPQNQSTVASLFGGGAVVAYHTTTSSGFDRVVAQRYAADGTRLGSTIAVGPTGVSVTDQNPAAAGLQDGGFVIAYAEPFTSASTTAAIYVQRFDSGGASTGAPVKVNTAAPVTSNGLDHPAVAVLQDGSFVVAYRNGPPAKGTGNATILAQHFSATGAPLGGEVTVATDGFVASYGISSYSPPTITALHDGGYAVAWDSAAPDGTGVVSVRAQVFSADGTKQGASFAASTASDTFQMPAATTLTDGRLLIAGSDYNGTGSDIRNETFSFPTTASTPTAYGRVIDGLVKGATVFADANGNGRLDAGEATATTDAYGRYSFTAPASGPVIATGGTDTYTGLPFAGTLSAPAGSLSVTALSTLVQKVMASGGGSVGDALLRVSLALGLSPKTDLTALNPFTDTLNAAGGAGAALVADAVVLNTLSLAKAAGATGDLFGGLAAQIAGASYTAVDPTATSTLQGLGLDYVTAYAVSALAKAEADLLAQKLADAGSTGRSLVADVVATSTLTQGAEVSDLTAATAAGFAGPVITKYTGSNLAAQVDAGKQQQAGTPYGISYTDVTTNGLGYTNGDAYSGPVAGLQHQYIWGSTDKVAIGASTSNVFLHGGSGDDAVSVSGGTNVLDGGTGSNFLVGATGSSTDTFFVDGRGGGVTWSTIVNFHAGDSATIFGFNPGVSTQPFTALDGIGGYQGLTIHSELGGAGTGVNASMTFAGIDQATADAHFTITSGTLGAGTASATGYLFIQYNH